MFGLPDFPLKFANCPQILAAIGASLSLVCLDHVVHNSVVEIFTKMGVSCCGEDFKYTVIDREEGCIECTSTEVIHDNLGFAAFLVKTIRDGSSSGFIDNRRDQQWYRRLWSLAT